MYLKLIDGGVTAAEGFFAGGVCCGIKPGNRSKKDVALIYSRVPCTAAGVFTKNIVKAAPVRLSAERLKSGTAQGIIANSGNANCCVADEMTVAEKTAEIGAEVLEVPIESMLVASTGVIGQSLPIEPFSKNKKKLKSCVSIHGGRAAAEAIMTTDTVAKEFAVEVMIGGKSVHIGGIAKGSGMIHINMGTMLSFVTTDAAISQKMLQKAINYAVNDTFNMVSVDGDTSTNDTFIVLANGLAENAEINEENTDYYKFALALKKLCKILAMALARDGEGATRLLTCKVIHAGTKETARLLAKTVAASSLVKAAVFGADANWGRVLCAIGYSGAEVDINKIDVAFSSPCGILLVCKNGMGIPFSEEEAKQILSQSEITIKIDLNAGSASAQAYGCDLTYEYVKINGDYRT